MKEVNKLSITHSMENCLESIVRLSPAGEVVRVTQLSAAMHASPSTASKLASALAQKELVDFKKYGYITLTSEGRRYGAYLLRRHASVETLLCIINATVSETEEAEKLEHYFSRRTIENLEHFLSNYV